MLNLIQHLYVTLKQVWGDGSKELLAVRISNAQINRVLELHLHRVQGPAGGTLVSTAWKPDQLTLSSKATDVTRTREMTRNLPDLRVGMVKDFKGRVETGAYRISGMEVADNVLASVLISRSNM